MPQPVPALSRVVHFAPFDLDLRTGELWKDGSGSCFRNIPSRSSAASSSARATS